jgi:putative flippase GtrA
MIKYQPDSRSQGPSNSVPAVGLSFFTFLIVGILATATQWVILIVLHDGFDVGPALSSGIGYVLSGVLNYILNYRFSFRSQSSHKEAVWKFAIVTGLGLCINTVIMNSVTGQVGQGYILAQIAATACVLVWNFVGHRLWTFAANT